MTSYPAFCDHILHQNELVAAGICHGDTWNLIFINNMLGEILKLSPGRMDDEPFLPRLTRCGFDEVEESLSEPHGGELIAHHKEGSMYIIRWKSVSIDDSAGGEQVRLITMSKIPVDQINRVAELPWQELTVLLDSIHDGIWVIDSDGITLRVNKAMERIAGLRAEGFVRLGLFAGLRREEICGLLWDCVFESDTTPHIIVCRACRWPQHSQPEISNRLKSDAAARSIPIPPQLSEWLAAERARQQKSRSGDLSAFPVVGREDGRPITYSSLQSLLRSVAVRCAAPDRPLGSASPKHPAVRVTVSTKVTAHILRHTYITRLILGGVPLKRVQYLAGHADPTITIKIYTDLMGHAPEDLADDINAVFAPVQTPPTTPPTPPEAP